MTDAPTFEELLERLRALEEAKTACSLLDHLEADNDALYRLLFEEMLDEVHIWELVRNADLEITTWRLVDANPAALKSWNKSLGEVLGKTTDEIFPGVNATQQFMPIIKKNLC